MREDEERTEEHFFVDAKEPHTSFSSISSVMPRARWGGGKERTLERGGQKKKKTLPALFISTSLRCSLLPCAPEVAAPPRTHVPDRQTLSSLSSSRGNNQKKIFLG